MSTHWSPFTGLEHPSNNSPIGKSLINDLSSDAVNNSSYTLMPSCDASSLQNNHNNNNNNGVLGNRLPMLLEDEDEEGADFLGHDVVNALDDDDSSGQHHPGHGHGHQQPHHHHHHNHVAVLSQLSAPLQELLLGFSGSARHAVIVLALDAKTTQRSLYDILYPMGGTSCALFHEEQDAAFLYRVVAALLRAAVAASGSSANAAIAAAAAATAANNGQVDATSSLTAHSLCVAQQHQLRAICELSRKRRVCGVATFSSEDAARMASAKLNNFVPHGQTNPLLVVHGGCSEISRLSHGTGDGLDQALADVLEACAASAQFDPVQAVHAFHAAFGISRSGAKPLAMMSNLALRFAALLVEAQRSGSSSSSAAASSLSHQQQQQQMQMQQSQQGASRPSTSHSGSNGSRQGQLGVKDNSDASSTTSSNNDSHGPADMSASQNGLLPQQQQQQQSSSAAAVRAVAVPRGQEAVHSASQLLLDAAAAPEQTVPAEDVADMSQMLLDVASSRRPRIVAVAVETARTVAQQLARMDDEIVNNNSASVDVEALARESALLRERLQAPLCRATMKQLVSGIVSREVRIGAGLVMACLFDIEFVRGTPYGLATRLIETHVVPKSGAAAAAVPSSPLSLPSPNSRAAAAAASSSHQSTSPVVAAGQERALVDACVAMTVSYEDLQRRRFHLLQQQQQHAHHAFGQFTVSTMQHQQHHPAITPDVLQFRQLLATVNTQWGQPQQHGAASASASPSPMASSPAHPHAAAAAATAAAMRGSTSSINIGATSSGNVNGGSGQNSNNNSVNGLSLPHPRSGGVGVGGRNSGGDNSNNSSGGGGSRSSNSGSEEDDVAVMWNDASHNSIGSVPSPTSTAAPIVARKSNSNDNSASSIGSAQQQQQQQPVFLHHHPSQQMQSTSAARTVYITRIPGAITDEQLRQILAGYGEINKVRRYDSGSKPNAANDGSAFAFVEFQTVSQARAIVADLDSCGTLVSVDRRSGLVAWTNQPAAPASAGSTPNGGAANLQRTNDPAIGFFGPLALRCSAARNPILDYDPLDAIYNMDTRLRGCLFGMSAAHRAGGAALPVFGGGQQAQQQQQHRDVNSDAAFAAPPPAAAAATVAAPAAAAATSVNLPQPRTPLRFGMMKSGGGGLSLEARPFVPAGSSM